MINEKLLSVLHKTLNIQTYRLNLWIHEAISMGRHTANQFLHWFEMKGKKRRNLWLKACRLFLKNYASVFQSETQLLAQILIISLFLTGIRCCPFIWDWTAIALKQFIYIFKHPWLEWYMFSSVSILSFRHREREKEREREKKKFWITLNFY